VQSRMSLGREGGGRYREGSFTPCPVLGPTWDGQEIGIRGEVGGGLMMEGFMSEEKDFVLDPL